jgi:hypothetical protein
MSRYDINYTAVFVGAALTALVGVIWYSPTVFGRVWIRAFGYTEERVNLLRQTAGRAYTVWVLCYLAMALVFDMLLSHAGVRTAAGGMWLGFIVWLGFNFTVNLAGSMFSEKTITAFLVDAGFQLIFLLIMGAVLGAWR